MAAFVLQSGLHGRAALTFMPFACMDMNDTACR